MMPTELRLTVARTINVGNFQSVRIEAGLTVTLAPDEDIQAAEDEVHRHLHRALRRAWAAHQDGDMS